MLRANGVSASSFYKESTDSLIQKLIHLGFHCDDLLENKQFTHHTLVH